MGEKAILMRKDELKSLMDALDHLEAGDIEAAHRLVQQTEGEPVSDSLHAIIHRRSGDLSNSAWWWRKVGTMIPQELGRLYNDDPVAFGNHRGGAGSQEAADYARIEGEEIDILRKALMEPRI